MSQSRQEVLLHAVEVVSAVLFGWFVTHADYRWYSISVAAIGLASLVGQWRLATTRWQAEIGTRLEALLALLQLPGGARATYHVPRWRKGYRQAVNYVPDGSGRGRRFQADEGVVGKCLREKKQLFVNFNSQGEFDQKMTSEFGFDATEKSRRTQNRRSYMAHPVYGEGERVIGVVYMDTSEADALPPSKQTDPLDLVDRLAGEIAKISAMYGKA